MSLILAFKWFFIYQDTTISQGAGGYFKIANLVFNRMWFIEKTRK